MVEVAEFETRICYFEFCISTISCYPKSPQYKQR